MTIDHIAVLGLGYGDEGKGATVDFLCRIWGARPVIRFNGGHQAAHNVVDPSGRWHCFAQFGSGTLVPGSQTVLTRQMLVEPEALLAEAAVLQRKRALDDLSGLTLDPVSTVVTPFHKIVGQLWELARGVQRHGSCGMGVGQAVFDREAGLELQLGELAQTTELATKLHEISQAKWPMIERLMNQVPPEGRELVRRLESRLDPSRLAADYALAYEQLAESIDWSGTHFSELLASGQQVIFEGAQGALLDREHGQAPYITKTRTTFHNVATLVGDTPVTKLGVLRAYGHRHGAGPLPTEDAALTAAVTDPHNPENPWQGSFRLGWLDLPALRYAIAINGGVDGLALTCLDQLSGLGPVQVCVSYGEDSRPQYRQFNGWDEPLGTARGVEHLPKAARALLDFLQGDEGLNVPLHILSVGPRSDQRWLVNA